ncbi:MAG: M1 family metallopeptidase [Rhodothermales bacterium]
MFIAKSVQAQDAPPVAKDNLDLFAPLDLPAPTDRRTYTGEPGLDYWQQEVHYDIAVELDPATKRITGTETITYINNSPDALEHLYVELEQNLFAEGSRGSMLQGANSRWRGAFNNGGYDISRVDLIRGGQRDSANYWIDDTRMKITLTEALEPGGTLDIDLDFAFTIPEYGADRMGYQEVAKGTVYTIAQWFPQMAVYDDVNGWNTLPYLGQGEFYFNYGDFDLAFTVPSDFIVVATGELLNADEVLTPKQLERYEQAKVSETTVMIQSASEVGQSGSRPTGQEKLTWRFRAENVRDVAWAASQAFIWDAASVNGVLAQSAYPEEGIGTADNPGWERSTEYVQHSIGFYSEQWFPYPYPVAINVGGVVGGMEYPMIVFCRVSARDQALFGVTDHEFGHAWFPMIVGSDERRYAWMDEGFNTFMNYYSNLAFYGEASTRARRFDPDYIAGLMATVPQVSNTPVDRIRSTFHGFLSYRKPGKGLQILREYVLGPERFDPAFRAYIDRWAYKHPQPSDFYRTIEDVAGEDLDWFWRGWFNTNATFDQGLEVDARGDDGSVTITNHGGLAMPTVVRFTMDDGSFSERRIPVEAWANTDSYQFFVEGMTKIRQIMLDPTQILPDTDRTNDTWTAAGVVPSGN